ncbi:MAG: hypothetical protein ACXQTJ_03315, partial [Candidatus Syntropharchaeales archaeon]
YRQVPSQLIEVSHTLFVIDKKIFYEFFYRKFVTLERTKFPEGVLKFDGWSGCEVVFKNEGVTIYELLDENA